GGKVAAGDDGAPVGDLAAIDLRELRTGEVHGRRARVRAPGSAAEVDADDDRRDRDRERHDLDAALVVHVRVAAARREERGVGGEGAAATGDRSGSAVQLAERVDVVGDVGT